MNELYDLRKISRVAGARQDEGIRKIKKGPHVAVLALERGAQKKSNGYFLKAFDWSTWRPTKSMSERRLLLLGSFAYTSIRN